MTSPSVASTYRIELTKPHTTAGAGWMGRAASTSFDVIIDGERVGLCTIGRGRVSFLPAKTAPAAYGEWACFSNKADCLDHIAAVAHRARTLAR